jgi:acyl-CoA-binding protein
MEITLNVTIPDDVAADIQNGSDAPLSRRLLELAAIKAYEADLITEWGVISMLGLEDREELYALFKQYNVRDHNFTMN